MDTALRTDLPAGVDLAEAGWIRFIGSPRDAAAIDYSLSVLEADRSTGRIDFAVRWPPGAHCHHHRHLGSTMAAVLQGEQHLGQTSELETVTKVRRVGFAGPVPDGETHREWAGPDGLTMLFSVLAPDGRLFEMLDDEGRVLATVTIDDLVDLMATEAA